MTNHDLVPVILCGGNGSRLWPLSRELYPKQFLSFDGKSTMLEKTLERLNGLECSHPFVICNEEHRFIVAEQLRAKISFLRIFCLNRLVETQPLQ
jgi:mannose-1-phosphate guanylyltransferase